MSTLVVLSLFPGIGLLDRAFEEAGCCVVRGPDVLWGGDVRTFHPSAGIFELVIGGPPCQMFSTLAHLVRAQGREPRFGNLIPEFERCVWEAQPAAWLMENVRAAPLPEVDGYRVHSQLVNNRWLPNGESGLGAEQNRVRRISFGTRDGRDLHLELAALEAPQRFIPVSSDHSYVRAERSVVSSLSETPVRLGSNGKLKRRLQQAVTAADAGEGSSHQTRYTFAEACRLQGLPDDFLADAPFTASGKLKAVANGVPLPMGRAIAAAVLQALSLASIAEEERA